MRAYVLAGGFATRLWPLTEKRAKPLLLINKKTVLEHVLQAVPEEVPVTILTNARFADDFTDELAYLGRKADLFIEDAYGDGEKLGALRAVSLAVQQKNEDGDIAILAGDNIMPAFSLSDLDLENFEAKLIVKDIYNKESAKKFGVAQVAGKKILGFEEKPDEPKATTVNTGFMSLSASVLPFLHERAAAFPDNLGGIVPFLLEKSLEVGAKVVDGDWFDVGSFESYLEAHKVLSVSDLCPSGCSFFGKVSISDDVLVKNSLLKDCIVYPGAKIVNSTLSNCVIDENCVVSGVDLHHVLLRKGVKVEKI